MTHFQESIEVAAPVELVYAVWANFERYPEFMANVREVRPLGGGRLAWRGRIWGDEQSWEAQITEQAPNERIAWRSLGGPHLATAVALTPTGVGRTRVTLSRDINPVGFAESLQTLIRTESDELRAILQRFRIHVELLGAAAASPRDSAASEGESGGPARAADAAPPSGDDPRPNPGMSAPGAVTTPPSPAPPGFTGARGRGSAPPGGAGISQQGGGTGGMGGDGNFGDDTGTGGTVDGLGLGAAGASGASGGDGRSSTAPAPTDGGVAVNQGRGSDLGTTGEPLEGGGGDAGMSGGTFGGSRESDLGAGLSDGMRSAQGPDASGGTGGAADHQPGLPGGQGRPPAGSQDEAQPLPRAPEDEKKRRQSQ